MTRIEEMWLQRRSRLGHLGKKSKVQIITQTW